MAKEPKSPICKPGSEKPDNKERKSSGLLLDRRAFLGTMAAIGGTAALGSTAKKALASAEFEGYPNSFGVLTDISACVGCRSCEKACNEANGLPAPAKPFEDESVLDETRRTSAKAFTVVNRYENPKDKSLPVYRKIQCNHCKDPACATACPIHAYSKTPEGSVLYNPDLCFGCRYCMTACPFYIPAYDYWSALEPQIMKCTMCYPRISAGKLPACAEACPAGALTFGKRSDLLQLARKKIVENPDKYIDHIYGEHEVGGTNWLYISNVPFEQVGLPSGLSSRPLVEETKGFLSAVPLVFTVWPALFGMSYAAVRHRESEEEEKGEKNK